MRYSGDRSFTIKGWAGRLTVEDWFDQEVAASAAAPIFPAGVPTAEAIGAPSMSAGIAPAGVATSEAFGIPTALPSVSPAGLSTGEVFGQPAASASVQPAAIFAPGALGVPALLESEQESATALPPSAGGGRPRSGSARLRENQRTNTMRGNAAVLSAIIAAVTSGALE